MTDSVWRVRKSRLRHGRVSPHDITMLRSPIIGHESAPPDDFNQLPWADAHLVTPRHSVRVEWNREAVRKHCKQTGNQLFVCKADDRIHGKPLTLRERYVQAEASKSRENRRHRDLPDEVELARGIKVMV